MTAIVSADKLHEIALYRCIRHHMQPYTWVIWCVGCNRKLRANQPHHHEIRPGMTVHRLAERAMQQGWDIDGAGEVICPACQQVLQARIARVEGHRVREVEEERNGTEEPAPGQ